MTGGDLNTGHPCPACPHNVFLSHSRCDAEWADRFKRLLAPLERRRILKLWLDARCLQVGDAWEVEIERAISRSELALLLVSDDFLESDFITGTELPTLTRYDVRLAPALIRDCLYEYEPALVDVQWLGKIPLSSLLDKPGDLNQHMAVMCRKIVKRLRVGESIPRSTLQMLERRHLGALAPQRVAEKIKLLRPLFAARRSMEPVGARLAAQRATSNAGFRAAIPAFGV